MAAFLSLWLTLVGGANSDQATGGAGAAAAGGGGGGMEAWPANFKGALVVAFVAAQVLFKLKSYWIVLLGGVLGFVFACEVR